MTNYCKNCDSQVKEGWNYCNQCGYNLERPVNEKWSREYLLIKGTLCKYFMNKSKGIAKKRWKILYNEIVSDLVTYEIGEGIKGKSTTLFKY